MTDKSDYCALGKDFLADRHPDDLSLQDHETFDKHLEGCLKCCRATLRLTDQEIEICMSEALMPELPLPSWEEMKQKYAMEQALSLLSAWSVRNVLAYDKVLNHREFDIREVGTKAIVKEKKEQFITAWPLLRELVGGRS